MVGYDDVVFFGVLGRQWQVCRACAEVLGAMDALERATVPKEAQ